MDSTTIYQEVAKHYNAAAKAGSLTNAQAIAKEFGYTTDDLQVVPEDANTGLSCGNPLGIADLRPVRY